MPGKDFEKQVQQKMDELHFAPSDAVWQKVEKQISGRKKRRALLWLPFLILFLGGAAWLFYPGSGTGNNKKQQADEKNTPVAIESSKQENTVAARNQTGKEIKQTYPGTAAMVKKNIPGRNDAPPADENNKAKSITVNNNSNHKNNIAQDPSSAKEIANAGENDHKKNISGITKNREHAGYISNDKPALTPVRTKGAGKLQAGKLVAADEEIVALNVAESKKENNKTGQLATEEKTVTAAPVPLAVNDGSTPVIAKAAIKDSLKSVSKTDSTGAVTKSKPAGKTKKKIEWGISLDGGVSKISQGLSGLFSVTRSYDMAAFSSIPGNSTSNVNGSSNNNNLTGPSDVRPGFAYAAGIFISKPLGMNTRILAGLNYNYNSTNIEIGAKIDSNTGTIQYHTGHSGNYTNHFHFIEVPVMIEKQLGRASRFSVNGGIAFSLLAGSNALQYNVQKDIYNTDNGSINKTQLGLLAGFNYRVLQKTVQLEIGPQFNYNLINTFKKELYGSRHMLFAGISTKIYFRKNKQ